MKSKGQDYFKNLKSDIRKLKTILWLVLAFLIAPLLWNSAGLNKKVVSLELYKKACIHKTSNQHEINMKFLELIKPALLEHETKELIELLTGESNE